MTPELRRIGIGGNPVVVLDGFSGAREEVVATAAAMAPFARSHGTYYPGLRRVITPADTAANLYVERMLRDIAPFVGGAFDVDGFDLLEASFSMVTAPPETLTPAQRAPHFDSTDPDYLAVLHYLSDTPGTGTAFYRQRATGIEAVDPGNVDAFVAAARRDSAAMAGYTSGANAWFDQVAAVEGAPDRLIVYQGCMLHSGIIPPDMAFSADPRVGRLTANIFIQGKREHS